MFSIETKSLTKKYGSKTAVNSLDLTVNEGEIFALLGVNGAGKTTAVRMMSCLCKPSGGECFIMGKSCLAEPREVKKLIGISTQDTAVAENLTVRENLEMFCGIYGYPRGKTAEVTAEMLSLFNMQEVQNQRAKTLSGGWKRKLSITLALVGEPRVLFLDEPTLGLDVLARRELWGVVKSLKGKVTIVLTTHYLDEAEQLADRIAIMANGEIMALGTLAELEKMSGEKGLEDVFIKIVGGGVHDTEF